MDPDRGRLTAGASYQQQPPPPHVGNSGRYTLSFSLQPNPHSAAAQQQHYPSTSSAYYGDQAHSSTLHADFRNPPSNDLNEGVSQEAGPSAVKSETTAAESNSNCEEPGLVDDGLEEMKPLKPVVHNMMCNFQVPCHIDLRKLAHGNVDVIYNREKACVEMRKRRPKCHANVFSSGKVTVVGCKTETDAWKAARRVARSVQRIQDDRIKSKIRLLQYRISNIMASCNLPFKLDLPRLAFAAKTFGVGRVEFEPELNTGLLWRFKQPTATLTIQATGSINVTGAKKVDDICQVLNQVQQTMYECRRAGDDVSAAVPSPRTASRSQYGGGRSNATARSAWRPATTTTVVSKRARLDKRNTPPLSIAQPSYLVDQEEEELRGY